MSGTPNTGVNTNDTGPPDWIDENFIKNAIGLELIVISFTVENAVPVGENFATIVYRAIAETTKGQFNLIIKCIPENEFQKKILRDGNMIEREIRMYTKTLPMLKESSDHPQFPRCYHVQEGDHECIVLQDMSPRGFSTRPRQLGFDEAHCRLAITELAHIHGASAALRIKQPDVFQAEILEPYKDDMYAEKSKRNGISMVFSSSLKVLSDAVKSNFPLRFHRIGELMTRMSEHVIDIMKNGISLPASEEERENMVLVLNHGDFWANNMLFKYDNDSPTACCLVDFQLSRCVPPVIDILYFFYTSTTQAVRRAHMKELLQFYLDESLKVISAHGVESPGNRFYKNLEELMTDMKKYYLFAFTISSFVLPSVVAEQDLVVDASEIFVENFSPEGSSPLAKLYTGAMFRKRYAELLEDFDDLGVFETYAASSKIV